MHEGAGDWNAGEGVREGSCLCVVVADCILRLKQ